MRLSNFSKFFANATLLLFVISFSIFTIDQVKAITINIVALGASNTAGKGVASSSAWPAQLEGMLRAKGYDVNMTVSGTMGATSEVILSGVDSAVRPGTQIVIFDTGGNNDRKRGVSPSARQANTLKFRAASVHTAPGRLR